MTNNNKSNFILTCTFILFIGLCLIIFMAVSLKGQVTFNKFQDNTITKQYITKQYSEVILQPQPIINKTQIINTTNQIYEIPQYTANCIKIQQRGNKSYELHCEQTI